MVQMIAGKNAQLMEKIEIISRKSLREKTCSGIFQFFIT